jgi:hypothetical protein
MADEINTSIMYEQAKLIVEVNRVRMEIMAMERALLRLDLGLIPFPRPRPDPVATMKLQAKIFDNTKTAMIFSENMLKTFKETGIELKDDETFACAMYVVKKPTYISEVMDPTPEPALPEPALIPYMLSPDSSGDLGFPFGVIKEEAWPPIRYQVIMEPAIMKLVIKSREQGKINYEQVK